MAVTAQAREKTERGGAALRVSAALWRLARGPRHPARSHRRWPGSFCSTWRRSTSWPADHGVLADQPVHHQHRQNLESRKLHDDPVQPRLPERDTTHGGNGRRRHGGRRHRRLSLCLLHGPGGIVADQDRAVRGHTAAAVGELPGEGVLLAADLQPRRRAELEPAPGGPRPGAPDLHQLGRVHGVLLHLAAVHDHSGVRGPGACIPPSQIEASQDLGGRTWRTLRLVVLPLALPGDRGRGRSLRSR